VDSVVQLGQRPGGIDGVAATAQSREETQEGIGQKETMIPITDLQWRAYELTQQEKLSLEDAAKEMEMDVSEVGRMLWSMKLHHPTLFTDISSDGRRFDHGVSRFGGWCEGDVVKKF
jgi:hypothetical protein